MIPAVAHRIWLDEEPPERFEGYWRAFAELHPGWELVTWSDSSHLGWIRNRRTFDACTTHAGRSDVLRYEILAEHGGIYLDTDCEPLRAFDELLDGDPFCGWESKWFLCPSVMGGEAGHPAVQALLDRLPRWAERRSPAKPNKQTGPHFLTAIWKHRPDVRRLPVEAFYPVSWYDRENVRGQYPASSYAVHHWAGSWLKCP